MMLRIGFRVIQLCVWGRVWINLKLSDGVHRQLIMPFFLPLCVFELFY